MVTPIIKKRFNHSIQHNYNIIYCLDSNLTSFPLIIKSLNFQTKCIYAIANKDLIIAGGNLLINKIIASKNIIYPLDSEHFSLIDLFSINKNSISKIYITASGGPFYFKKKDVNKVTKKEVLNHPKWRMGTDISIDSSNFINNSSPPTIQAPYKNEEVNNLIGVSTVGQTKADYIDNILKRQERDLKSFGQDRRRQ